MQLVSTDDRIKKYVEDIVKLLCSNDTIEKWNELVESVTHISMENDFITKVVNGAKVSPVMFVYQDLMKLEMYTKTHLFNASSTEIRNKVKKFLEMN